MRGPLYPPDPPLFSLFHSFSTPALPEAEIPHRSHSTVRLSHGAPFLILTQHQSETPHTHQTHSYVSRRAEVWETTYCTTGAMKRRVDLRGDVRRDETELSSACQHKINHPLDNQKYPGGDASTRRDILLNVIILLFIKGRQKVLRLIKKNNPTDENYNAAG